MDSTKWTAIGKIVKAHGIKGEVRLKLDFTFLFPVQLPEILFLEAGSIEPIPYFIQQWDVLDDQTAILKFEETLDRNSAENLSGKQVFLKTEDAEAFEVIAEENIFANIEGFKLFDKNNLHIGTIKEVQWFPAHPLAILDSGQIIPLHEDFLVEKIIKDKTLIMNLPEGLLDV